MNAHYFSKRPDVVSLTVVTSHLVVVLSPIVVAAALGPGWYMAALWGLFGLSMNGPLNLMHECAHGHLFGSKYKSDFLGRYVLAPFVFADFDRYRLRHWDHHRFVGLAGETKDTYLIDIRGRGLLRTLGRCLLLKEAALKFLRQTAGERSSNSDRWRWLVRIAILQVTFQSFLLCAAKLLTPSASWTTAFIHAAWAYGIVYLYGLMSLTVFMASLRAIAEHQQYGDGSAEQGYAALRNFACTPLSRYLMGAYGFGEHSTHHRQPGIPYYNLPPATRELSTSDPSLVPVKGYFEVLTEIVTQRSVRASSRS